VGEGEIVVVQKPPTCLKPEAEIPIWKSAFRKSGLRIIFLFGAATLLEPPAGVPFIWITSQPNLRVLWRRNVVTKLNGMSFMLTVS
jgi:hypothetical protein